MKIQINALGEVSEDDRLLSLREAEALVELESREGILIRDWNRLDADYGSNLFRFYGYTTAEDTRILDLEMEFTFPANDGDVRTRLRSLCDSFGATWEVMDVRIEEPDEQPEVQVAFRLNVFGQDHEGVGKVVKRWRDETTKRGLNHYWVSLL